MAIESIREIWEGRAGAVFSDGGRSYTRTFRVVTSDNLRDGIECLYLGDLEGRSIPRMFTPYVNKHPTTGVVLTYDPGSYAQNISASQDPIDPMIWTVTVEYSSKLPELSRPVPGAPPPNAVGGPGGVAAPNTGGPAVGSAGAPSGSAPQIPQLPATEVEWSFSKFQRAAREDLDGKLVANSAGQQFDPPIMIDDSRLMVRVTRNELGFNPGLATFYQDTVNSDSFFGAAPRTAKLTGITSSFQQQDGILFYRTTYVIEFRWDTWRLKVLDAGYMEKVGGSLRNILDSLGNQVSAPHPLNGSGLKSTNLDTPYYLEFKVYREVPFGPLGLSPF